MMQSLQAITQDVDSCSKKTKNVYNIILHKCNACRLKFTSIDAYNKHQHMHEEYPTKFVYKSSSVGVSEDSSLTEPLSYKCKFCMDLFPTLEKLKHHMTDVHQIKEKKSEEINLSNGVIKTQVMCTTCSKVLKDYSSWKAHMLTHSDQRNFACDWLGCTYSFKTKGSLKRHRRRHTDERPYVCEDCNRSFRESGSLTRHQKSRIPCTSKTDADFPKYGKNVSLDAPSVAKPGSFDEVEEHVVAMDELNNQPVNEDTVIATTSGTTPVAPHAAVSQMSGELKVVVKKVKLVTIIDGKTGQRTKYAVPVKDSTVTGNFLNHQTPEKLQNMLVNSAYQKNHNESKQSLAEDVQTEAQQESNVEYNDTFNINDISDPDKTYNNVVKEITQLNSPQQEKETIINQIHLFPVEKTNNTEPTYEMNVQEEIVSDSIENETIDGKNIVHLREEFIEDLKSEEIANDDNTEDLLEDTLSDIDVKVLSEGGNTVCEEDVKESDEELESNGLITKIEVVPVDEDLSMSTVVVSCDDTQQVVRNEENNKDFKSEDNALNVDVPEVDEKQGVPLIDKNSCQACKAYIGDVTVLKDHLKQHLIPAGYKCPVSGCRYIAPDKKPLFLHLKVTHRGQHDDKVDSSMYSDSEDVSEEKKLISHPATEEERTIEPPSRQHVRLANTALRQLLELEGNLETQVLLANDQPVGVLHGCPVCHRKFTLNYLKIHIRAHTGEKPHKCLHCSKLFRTKDTLKKHITSHSDTRNYKCGECGKMFKRISHAREHLKVHSGDRPFKCQLCDKTFKSANGCKVHLRTHNNVLPFKCTEEDCGKSFREKSSLDRHLRIHTGEKPYSCKHCGRRFAEHGTLNRHYLAKVPCTSNLRKKYWRLLDTSDSAIPKHKENTQKIYWRVIADDYAVPQSVGNFRPLGDQQNSSDSSQRMSSLSGVTQQEDLSSSDVIVNTTSSLPEDSEVVYEMVASQQLVYKSVNGEPKATVGIPPQDVSEETNIITSSYEEIQTQGYIEVKDNSTEITPETCDVMAQDITEILK